MRRIRLGYTDECLILGRNTRDAEEYARYLRLDFPERILGYDLLLASLDSRLQGLAVQKYLVSPYAERDSRYRDDQRVWMSLSFAVLRGRRDFNPPSKRS